MTVRDYILGGIEAELALQRSLGVRVIDVDVAELKKAPVRADAEEEAPKEQEPAEEMRREEPQAAAPQGPVALAFLHHEALSPKAEEIVRKIAGALKLEAAVFTAPPLPPAKAYVVMGSAAAKKFFPGEHASPGNYLSDPANAFVTYSPELFIRLGIDSPEVVQRKRAMWTGIKGVVQRYEIR